jgi:hypothetical protein
VSIGLRVGNLLTRDPILMYSALAVENAKPREKEYMLADGNGLHLLVMPHGRKLWRLRYRFGGKQNSLSLGSFPEVSLASARAIRDNARRLIAEGVNPSEHKKHEKLLAEIAANDTFGAIAEEYLKRLEEGGAARATVSKNRCLLMELASPLHKRPAAKVTPAEILTILKKYEKAGLRETAKRLRGIIGAVFRLAVATLRAETDPTYALRGAIAAPIVSHRAAITDEKQLGALMVAIDGYEGWPTRRSALLFLALSMVRPGEVRHMRRNEVLWPSATWRIPAERMKKRRRRSMQQFCPKRRNGCEPWTGMNAGHCRGANLPFEPSTKRDGEVERLYKFVQIIKDCIPLSILAERSQDTQCFQ